jgi:hypothetical protein
LEALASVAAENATTLRELSVGVAGAGKSCADLRRLLSAAPSLRTLAAGAVCCVADATAVLAGAPPFGPLRLRRLSVYKEAFDGRISRAVRS